LTILSCDNIQGNGSVARTAFLGFANAKDSNLARWMEREFTFPNSMVDRVTPCTVEADIDYIAQTFGYRGGGQVLVSQATQTLIEDEEEGEIGFTLVDVGEYRLKDLDRPVRLFQLAAAGLAAPSLLAGRRHAAGGLGGPGAGGGAAVVHGWPVALTSFVGRGRPVREVAGLLAEHRLVTVTGSGGSGKTRLAGEVARRVAGRFADGAWLVELAPVADPGQVASVVAAALGCGSSLGCRPSRRWRGCWPASRCCWCWIPAST
jgi:hypothetical protein